METVSTLATKFSKANGDVEGAERRAGGDVNHFLGRSAQSTTDIPFPAHSWVSPYVMYGNARRFPLIQTEKYTILQCTPLTLAFICLDTLINYLLYGTTALEKVSQTSNESFFI